MVEKFDVWYNKNEDKLVNKFLEDNADLGIHHHDYPNIPSMTAFQNFVEEEYKKKFQKKTVVKRRKDGVIQRYNVQEETCRMCKRKLDDEEKGNTYCFRCDELIYETMDVERELNQRYEEDY